MKILLVITKAELGGAQVFVSRLARGLKDAGHEVKVAGGPGDYLPSELRRFGVEFIRLKRLERSRNPFKALAFISELKHYVAAENFDIVHLNSTNALLGAWSLSRLKPKPRLVFTVHGLSLIDPSHQAVAPLRLAYRLFFRSAFRLLDSIAFVSRLNFEFAKSAGILTAAAISNSRVIYNGLDFKADSLMSREEARKELAKILNLSPEAAAAFEDAFVYGSIGRLAYPKNYEFLINSHAALKKVYPNAKLLIIGDGPERVKYEGFIDSYRLTNEAYLAGELPEAGKYLAAFDLFVLPSVFEGLSLSLIEARRAGVPAIASLVGGNEEIIGRENCFTLNNQSDYLDRASKARVISGAADTTFSELEMVSAYLKAYKD